MIYNTTNFVLEVLIHETSKWSDLYSPNVELDLDEVLLRYKQMKQLCPGIQMRCRRLDTVHTTETTSTPIDLEEVLQKLTLDE